MKRITKVLSLLVVAVMIFALAACSSGKVSKDTAATDSSNVTQDNTQSSSNETTDNSGAKDKKIVFGISMPQLDNDGFKANLISIQQFAEEYGIELITSDAKNTADLQMQHIEDFITKKVDAIVMCPIDSGALAAAVKKANEAGIPVAAFDRNVSGGELAGLAESDNRAHGAKAAELMAEVAKKSGMDISELKVLELQGALSTSAGLERHEGFVSKAQELGINIVSSLPTEFKSDIAYSAVMDALQAKPEINAIFVPSDNACYNGVESALTQINRLKKTGEKGHIIITTVDGGPLGLEGIRNGYIDAIAAQSKLLMSHEAMMLAYKTVTGEKIENPIVRIPPTPVTIDNVDDESLWANAIKKMKK
ncbi:MAG: sugar ABC transporter substrate-binding protein [Bacillota bacterium]